MTATRGPGQLPAEVTGFVGRQAELGQLSALLGRARLVTVTGTGGVGKTRLALRAAAAAAPHYTHGVAMVELSGLRDPELLANTVATGLGLPDQDARSQFDAVLDHLRDRGLLLILDTCEHLIDACALLAEAIVREAPGVTVLATSRQPLDVPGEHTYLVPPLRITGDDGRTAGEAVELLAQRAAAAVPGFELTEASHDDVIRLCRRLDGIPLAIELAAVRLRAVPLERLVERLEDRFRVLDGGRRSAVPRHQTLRTAIEWSHDLCSPRERDLWARLSVFAGSFDLAAVEDVCADGNLTRDDALPILIGLVDKSVVARSDEPDSTRYRMLDTLREFGAERLAADGAEHEYRGRHIARYLAMARHFGDHFLDDDQMHRFHELRAEHANIRAALEYALAVPGHQDDAAELATSLYGYWQISGSLREGDYWLTKVLDRLTGPSPRRAWALIVRGFVRTFEGEIHGAIDDLAEGTPMAESLGAELVAARGYLYQNLAFTFAGRHDEARYAGAEAGRRLAALGDYIGLISLQPQMGHLHQLAGELDLAVERCAHGLALLGDDTGERWIQSYLHLVTGFALFQQPGKQAECAAAVVRALRTKHELGDVVGIAYALEVLAWLAAGDQRYERAAWLLGAANTLWERAGNRLSSTAIMEEFHQRAAKATLGALGTEWYESLSACGGTQPLDLVVTLAADNVDEMRACRPEERAATLTARETEIAGLVVQGLSNREIAQRLVISKRTVDAHVEHIFAKLGVRSRVQIAGRLDSSQRDRHAALR